MSMMIKEARGRTQGAGPAGMDQGGFFSFLGGVAKKVGAVVGGPVGLATSFIPDKRARQVSNKALAAAGRPIVTRSSPFRRPGVGAPFQLPDVDSGFLSPAEVSIGRTLSCPKGYHPNKSDYYTSRGFVAEGTKCVRDQRRNSLNPRALTRAVGRVKSAKSANKILSRITIRSAKSCK